MCELKDEFKSMRDSYDPWGSTMEVFFAVSNELFMRGAPIPGDWLYSPGMASDPRDEESYYYDLALRESDEDLIAFGNVLHRYTNFLDRAGLSY